MAEATMNTGGMPPQLPPAVPAAAGDAGAGGLPLATGTNAGRTQLPAAMQGVSGGFNAFRDWIDNTLRQPTVRRAALPLAILLLLVIVATALQFTQSTPYRPIMPGMTETDKQAAIEALKAGDFKPRVDTS
ncbi:MAG: hypothetical protein NBV65_12780, partial [Burkholderiaceae bacterium]|nr:hypothetical protein [Burkholderiaceae bacterium]